MTASAQPAHPRTIRVATRTSALALWQAEHVATLLRAAAPGHAVELVHVITSGDQNQSSALSTLGGFGVFTREVQKVVLESRADLAVHSLKDLPTEPTDGLTLGCVPERELVADALVLPQGCAPLALAELPESAKIGTGSLRRRAQILHFRPDFQPAEIRGNVDTRLRKLDAGEFDAIVLAVAGLTRLGLAQRISARLEPPMMLAAVGQGALGLECRADDAELLSILAKFEDASARVRVTAERRLLATLRAGCHAPVGAHTEVRGDNLFLQGVVLSADGKSRLSAEETLPRTAADELGRRVAQSLLAQGAQELIRPTPAS